MTRFSMLPVVSTVFLVCSGAVHAQENDITPGLHRLGTELYQMNCSICHGATGQGDGVLASEFAIGPRNFTIGNFRFATTPVGTNPARSDIMNIIQNGIEGSYGRVMPSFPDFSDSELQALAEVVRQFAGITAYGDSIDVPENPEIDLTQGAILFEEFGCTTCHGAAGRGDGPVSGTLTDVNGQKIRPADLTLGQFKGGSDVEDVWLRIHNGIPGTPMPSFGQNASLEEIWALAIFVKSLSVN